ncbi:putative antigenic cell wall galactomannoprotein [Xylariales sp. AK1849]|nr:putative antigenic cell wall galactomannoprotein [Xylariales sp. AK1849]
MKLSLALTTLATLVGTALADGAAIVSALEQISSDTTALNDTVNSWSGDLLGALPITAQSTTLLTDINKATSTAKSSDNLTTIETYNVAITTLALVSDTNSTLDSIIAAKPKFDKLLLSPIILLTLQSEKDASDKLTSAVAEKVPTAFVSAAEAFAAQLDEKFGDALNAYSLF